MPNISDINVSSLPADPGLLNSVLSSLDSAVVATDAEGTICLWNPAAERLYGYSQQEALGKSLNFVVPEKQHRDLERLMRTLLQGQPVSLPDSVHVHKTGKLIDVSVELRPLLGSDSGIQGALAVAVDTSQFRRFNERLLLAFEASPSGKVIVDQEGKMLMVNAEMERLFGYPRQEMLGRNVDMLVPRSLSGGHGQHRLSYGSKPMSRMMGGGRELFGLRRDGTEFPVEIGLNPMKTREGLLVLAAVADITERKQAEEQFRVALESAPCGIVMVDASGTILLVNLETERLFGYERGSMVGMNIDKLVPQRYRAGHHALRAGFAGQPEARSMGAGRDLFGLRRDGSEFPVEIGLNPIKTASGVRVLAAILDITERKQIAETLSRHAEELARSNADLEQFAYVASHDLQEPLRMVASYVELLEERYKGQLDEKADKYIHYAVDGAKRMKQLVSDLLTFSRVGTQGKPLVPVEAGKVLRIATFELQSLLKNSEASVTNDELPTVLADETQLLQLLQNLISNAIKFRGEQAPLVHISAEQRGTDWQFEVRDNGIGIDPRYAERVFQMFQRLHERGRYDGSGIGLSIAKRIVERHGGRIWFESVQGGGTRFLFTLKGAGRDAGA